MPAARTRPSTPNSCGAESQSKDGEQKSRRSISLNEKLKRSQPIWYLPQLDRYSILHKLSNKQDGVSMAARTK